MFKKLFIILYLFSFSYCEYLIGSEIGLTDQNTTITLSEENIQKIKEGAKNGNLDSIYFLGLLHYYGFGGVKNVQKAIDTFTRAAKEGHAHSQLALGVINSQIEQHSTTAIQWLQASANQQNSDAMWLLGEVYQNQSNFNEAFNFYHQSANNDNVEGMYRLALLYEYGYGIPKNTKKAKQWYERASNKNHLDSIYNLGLMYTYGRGTKQDFGMAGSLFLKAANQGHGPSLYYLGIIYFNGYGVNMDYSQAVYFFEKAKETNDYRIIDKVNEILLKLNDAIDKMDVEKDKYYRDA